VWIQSVLNDSTWNYNYLFKGPLQLQVCLDFVFIFWILEQILLTLHRSHCFYTSTPQVKICFTLVLFKDNVTRSRKCICKHTSNTPKVYKIYWFVAIRVVPRASFNSPERPTLFGAKYVFGASHQALTRESAVLRATQTHLTK